MAKSDLAGCRAVALQGMAAFLRVFVQQQGAVQFVDMADSYNRVPGHPPVPRSVFECMEEMVGRWETLPSDLVELTERMAEAPPLERAALINALGEAERLAASQVALCDDVNVQAEFLMEKFSDNFEQLHEFMKNERFP